MCGQMTQPPSPVDVHGTDMTSLGKQTKNPFNSQNHELVSKSACKYKTLLLVAHMVSEWYHLSALFETTYLKKYNILRI